MSAKTVWLTALRVIAMWAVMLCDTLTGAVSWAAESKALDPDQVYAKQATWAETMIATRDNCASGPKARRRGRSPRRRWLPCGPDFRPTGRPTPRGSSRTCRAIATSTGSCRPT